MLHVACLSSALLLRLSLGNCCVQLFVEFYAYKVVFSTIFFYHFPSPPPSSLSICDWFHSSLSLSLFVCLGHFRVSWTAVMRFLKQFKAIHLSLALFSHLSRSLTFHLQTLPFAVFAHFPGELLDVLLLLLPAATFFTLISCEYFPFFN